MLGRLGLLTLAVALLEVSLGSDGQLVLLSAGLLDGAVALAARRGQAWFSTLAALRGLAALVDLTSGHPERIPTTLLSHAPGLFVVWCLAVARALEAQRSDAQLASRPARARPLPAVVAAPVLPTMSPVVRGRREPVSPLRPAGVPRRSAPKWRVGTTPIGTPPEVTSPSALRRLLSERPTSIFLRSSWRLKLTPTEDLFLGDETPTDID